MDGDGVNDGDEIPHSPSSCPSDASDNGSPTNCVTLRLTVGDPSGSNSERWNMEMEILEEGTGKAVVCHCDAGFGAPGSARYALVKGKAYIFKLRWIATDPEYTGTPKPDFDWQARINDSTAAGVYEGLNGTGAFIVEDPDTLLTDETHGNHNNITIGREGRILVPKVEFVTGAASCYNFSPSLGEEAALDVKVTPTPPAGGFPGLHFRLEIVRETANNSEQHIDWVDVDDTADYYAARELDFAQKQFAWDGIPDLGFGASASQAYGRDSFQGESASASATRIFPASALGQPVPPPFVTAVAKIMRNYQRNFLIS